MRSGSFFGFGSWLTCALVALSALAACASTGSPVPLGGDADEWISAEVRRVLQRDDRIDASTLRVETRDGVVVLSGVASTLDQVRRALRLAGRVRGVEQIVNRIRVLAGRGLLTETPLTAASASGR